MGRWWRGIREINIKRRERACTVEVGSQRRMREEGGEKQRGINSV